MTKKFWKDWQKRVSETKQIYTTWNYYGEIENSYQYSDKVLHLRLDEHQSDKIVATKFYKNKVDITIDRKKFDMDLSYPKGYCIKSKLETITLNRKDIVTIEFKQCINKLKT